MYVMQCMYVCMVGISDMMRLQRLGFPVRIPFAEFLSMESTLTYYIRRVSRRAANNKEIPFDDAARVTQLAAQLLSPDEYHLASSGTSTYIHSGESSAMIFLKKRSWNELVAKVNDSQVRAARTVQANFRGFRSRKVNSLFVVRIAVISMQVWTYCMYVWIHIYISCSRSMYTYECMYACTYVHLYICMYNLSGLLSVCITYLFVCMYYLYMYVCMYVLQI